MSDLDSFINVGLELDSTGKLSAPSSSGADVSYVNELSRQMQMLKIPVPPPLTPQIKLDPRLSVQVQKMREAGNAAHQKKKHSEAVRLYTLGLGLASSRPWFEPSMAARDEISVLLSNRSVAHLAQGNLPESLVDADTVTQLRPNWAKGFFRKAQALKAMSRLQESINMAQIALDFEPASEEIKAFIRDVEQTQKGFYQ